MAKKKIREYDGKRMIAQHIARLAGVQLARVKPVQVTREILEVDWKKLKLANPWLLDTPLVAKPDMLFGKRGKYGLVKVNANLEEAKQFIQENMDKEVTIGGLEADAKAVSGVLTHWLIEPCVPHEIEFYFSLISLREESVIYFSSKGGVEVEEHWQEAMKELHVPVGQQPEDCPKDQLEALFDGVSAELRPATEAYVFGMFKVFEALDFVSMETNPFTLVKPANEEEEKIAIGGWLPVPLDLCAELDDTAHFQQTKNWGDMEFPEVFGRRVCPEERHIEQMDAQTGASLKLSLLTPAPKGRIWTLVAGGGASVIFADTVVDLGYGDILGNYGEYSGAPNAEQMYEYTKTVLNLATANPDGQGRVLLVGGGIANFTDVAKTFKGIIHALKEYKQKLMDAKMRIYVRRAGPNYQQGLELMKNLGTDLAVSIEVFGPERTMTEIIPMAIQYIKESSK